MDDRYHDFIYRAAVKSDGSGDARSFTSGKWKFFRFIFQFVGQGIVYTMAYQVQPFYTQALYIMKDGEL
jgi:hypothetical protein